MTTDTDPRMIAEGLTKAQKEAILGRCGVPRAKEEWSHDCICGEGMHAADLCGMAPSLAYRREYWPNGIVLTVLGLAVRAILEGQSDEQ